MQRTQHGVCHEAGGAAVCDGPHGRGCAAGALLCYILYERHHVLPPTLQLCAHDPKS